MEVFSLAGTLLGAASALPGLLGLGRDDSAGTPSGNSTAESAAPCQCGSPPDLLDMQALRQIVSRYDVGHITPRQLGQLAAELGQQQALGAAQVAELSAMRVELEQAGIEPDQPLDLVEHFQDRARTLQRAAERTASRSEAEAASAVAAYRQALSQLEWAQKLALVQGQPPNALASLA